MIKVLFIVNQFPPRGGPGVHRSMNLVKNIRSFGYEPIVVTVNEESVTRAGYTLDKSLVDQIPPDIQIFRTDSYEPIRLIRFLMKMRIYRFFWFVFYPLFWEYSAMWPFMIYKKCKNIIRNKSIKIIYTSSGPFSALILGYLLKRTLRVKWVADLRDPFTDAYAWRFPSKIHWLLMRYFEAKLLEYPDELVVNTDAVKLLLEERGIRKAKKTTVVNNGY